MISVFTPSHDVRHLTACYQSLRAQTDPAWEWIVVLNGGGPDWCPPCTDSRVKILRAPGAFRSIGALKALACWEARGEYLLELDHDDLLFPEALAKVRAAFERHPEAGFVYSDLIRFRDDGQMPENYGTYYGWPPAVEAFITGDFELKGTYTPSFAPTPQALARIWYAPDHLRAWRRSTYAAAGGHNPEEAVCDDYSLLLRSYLIAPFVHIPEPLYLYRVGANTSAGPRNAQIQTMQAALSDEYRQRIAETWAQREGLLLVDLCSHGNAPAGYLGTDLERRDGYVQADLDGPWPFVDGSVGVLRAQDALEHLRDKRHTMAEAHRVLAHGGWLFSETPSADGAGADMDPTHVSRWNAQAFWYWTREASRQFLPGYPAVPRFQCWDLKTYHPSEWHKKHGIGYVRAHLSAIKEGARLPGAYDLEEGYCG